MSMHKRSVVIKTWDKMIAQYVIDTDGTPSVAYGFTTDMEEAMPKNKIITVEFEDDSEEMFWEDWSISEEMIDKDIFVSVDANELDELKQQIIALKTERAIMTKTHAMNLLLMTKTISKLSTELGELKASK